VAFGAGGLIYTLFLFISPEPPYVFGPEGPIFGTAAPGQRFREIASP